MTDILTPVQRSALMAKVRSTGNASTELRLVAVFRALRITGWRRNHPLTGKPDFVFPKRKLAVLVDGCCSGLASPTGLVVASLLGTGTAARSTPPSRSRTRSSGPITECGST